MGASTSEGKEKACDLVLAFKGKVLCVKAPAVKKTPADLSLGQNEENLPFLHLYSSFTLQLQRYH